MCTLMTLVAQAGLEERWAGIARPFGHRHETIVFIPISASAIRTMERAGGIFCAGTATAFLTTDTAARSRRPKMAL